MAVPTAITDLSATAASNSPGSTEAVLPNLDDYLRAAFAFIRQGDTKAADIASASTTDLGAAVGRFVDVTGTTTITSFGTVAAGIRRIVRFTGALTLTHNATSLILPGGANITTAAGDCLIAESLGSGNWVVIAYQPATGYLKLSGGTLTGILNVTPTSGDAQVKLTGQGAGRTYILGSATTGNSYLYDSSLAANVMEFNSSGTPIFKYTYSVTLAGSANVIVDSAGGLYRATSSLRYKTDVRSYSNALQDALNLRPVTYASRSEREAGRRFMGFIAEEVDAAGIKDAVVYDEEGKPDALHYGQMIAIAIGAIQAQQQQIDALRAEIASLK